jgi:hypothetical protein
MTTVRLMNGKEIDFGPMTESLVRMGEAMAEASRKVKRFRHDFENRAILPEIRYFRLIARAEQAEAELWLERRMTEIYADLGLVRH